MNNTEIAFFGVAILLPLAGGALLLYFLSRDAKREAAKRENERPKDPE